MLQIVPSGSKDHLAFLARQMDVDILVSGHSHEFKVQYSTDYQNTCTCLSVLVLLPAWYNLIKSCCLAQADCVEGRLLINPGSATGAFNSLNDHVVPSFVLMDITGKKVGFY